MTPSGRAPRTSGFGPSLRLRIWIGCLGGSVAVAVALWVVISNHPGALSALGSELVWVWLPAIGAGGVLVGVLLAMWLSRGIVKPLRGLTRSVASGQFTDLRGLPSVSGWGELSELLQQVQTLLARQRQLGRSAAELEMHQQQIERIRDRLERWTRTGRFEPFEPEVGPLRALALALQRGIARSEGLRAETLAAAAELWAQHAASLADARETAEQAEHTFLEATSLLTTVRELQRLSGELKQALAPEAADAGVAASQAEAYQRYRLAAAEAIEELVSASTASVSHLADGMMRVAAISDQVQLVANRATLIALNAVAASRGAESGAPVEGEEFKSLAREVRAATDRAAGLTREIEADVAAAGLTREIEAHVAEALDRAPEPPAGGTTTEEAARLLDRVREMVQDATLKGERLSAAGERASRAAESLTRRLVDETAALERLAGAPERAEAAPAAEDAGRAETPSSATRKLKLLGREDLEQGPETREESR